MASYTAKSEMKKKSDKKATKLLLQPSVQHKYRTYI